MDRSRNRTPSRDGRRSRTPSDRYTYSDATYSDSFISDDDSYRQPKSKPSRHKASSTKKPPKAAAKGTGSRKKQAGRSSQALPHSPRNTDYVTKRMLSARRMKINELRNELDDLNAQLMDLRQENKLLKRQKYLSEKALNQYEDRENDVPNLIQRHSEELRALKEQLRRQKEKYIKADKRLKDTEDELDRTKRLLRKMKGLVEDKKLGEREELSNKLSKLESELDDKDRKLRGMEKHVDNLQKNHKHEMGIERARHRETQQQLSELREEMSKVHAQLKEREKELDVRNIYSKRLMRAPHRLGSSISSSPIPDLVYNSKPPRKPKPAEPEMTPREKMKMYEEKRREEDRKLRESPFSDEPPESPAVTKTSKPSPKQKKTFPSTPTKGNTKSFSKQNTDVPELRRSRPEKTRTLSPKPVRNEEPRKLKFERERTPSPVVKDVSVGSPSQTRVKKSVAASQKPSKATEKEEGYVPTFLTELKKDQSDARNHRREDTPEIKELSEIRQENTSPTIFDISKTGPKGQRAKAGRRSQKPEGTTHFKVEKMDRDSDSESPVMFDLNAASSSKKTRNQPRTQANKPGGNSLIMMEEDQSLPWEKAQVEKKRAKEKSDELREKEAEERRAQQEWEEKQEQERQRLLKEKQEQEAFERRRKEEEERKKEEEHWNNERERRKQEAIAHKEREEQARKEKLERERRERENKERKQREEDERRERERQLQLEKEEENHRLENEKLRQDMEEKEAEQRRQKDILLAKMRDIDAQKQSGKQESPSYKKSEYNFKQSIENMHHGKPAYDDVTVPVLEKQKKKGFLFDDDSDGSNSGYKPSFSGSAGKSKRSKKGLFEAEDSDVIDFTAPVKSEKKADLMDNLFGGSSKTSKKHVNGSDDLFFGSNKSTSGKARKHDRESSSTALFGGGNAIIDDSDTPKKNNAQLLPRRTKQSATTFHSGPAVNAVDDVDDEIEEVVL